jgi:uncharacterized protein
MRSGFHQFTALLLLGVVASTAACQDGTTPGAMTSRPAFAASGNGGKFAEFAPIAGAAACAVPPSTLAGFDTYQPFVIPAGFSQTILANEVEDFAPVAGSSGDTPDMIALNETGPHAGRFLYRTHEVGTNGAITVTDLASGVTSLVDQQTHYEALDGIVWTPWNTLLFAEERTVASRRDPRVPDAIGGLVYEYDPHTGVSTPRPAVGARSHEGLRIDAQGNLYGISESTPGVNGSGAIFKFVPDHGGDLSSGQLYALKVLDASRTGEAVWVPLDGSLSRINSDQAAVGAGATGWGRPEDLEIAASGKTQGGDVMFATSTSENLVLRIELDGDRAFVSNYVKEGVNVTGLENPDNLALDQEGNLYIVEDNGPGDIFFVPAGHGTERVASGVVRFASLSDCSAEPTGLYFDRNGKTAWVHVQHAGGALRNDLLVAFHRN